MSLWGQRTGQLRPRAIGRVTVAAAVLPLALALTAGASGAGTPSGRGWIPGSLISVQQISAPKGARAWKIMYRSSTGAGKQGPVSGLIIAPSGKPPRGGRNVLAWAHGTTGLTKQCAPSGVSLP